MASTHSQPGSDYLGFECHLCGTRMYARHNQVGHVAKCPDCGARTTVPPPPKPKPKNIPAALEGEQYELWEPDEQPLPAQIAALQPKYIAIACRKCQTLMYATEDQVGRTIICPDCRTQHIVPPPPRTKAKPSRITPDTRTPQLDPAAAPGERPAFVPTSTRQMVYEEERERELAEAVERARRRGKPLPFDARGRPIMPRWPLITGVLPFILSLGVPVRWLGLMTTMLLVGLLGSAAISMLGGMRGAATGISPDAMGAIAGVSLLAATCILGVIWLAAAASILITVVTESSEGNAEIQNWPPPNLFEWFPDLIYLVVAITTSLFPGWALAQLLAEDQPQKLLWTGGGLLLCFPVVLLSQLEISSPWAILSPRLLTSIVKCPFSWFTFYLESLALSAACAAAAAMGWNLIWLAPLIVAALLLYARLLGRLGWRIAEALPEPA